MQILKILAFGVAIWLVWFIGGELLEWLFNYLSDFF
jgi:hypothetical protein